MDELLESKIDEVRPCIKRPAFIEETRSGRDDDTVWANSYIVYSTIEFQPGKWGHGNLSRNFYALRPG